MSSRSRAVHLAARLAIAATLALSITTPVAAGEITATVLTSSPLSVTVGKPVAYPVTVQNTGRSTLNFVMVRGTAAPGFTYLGATPASICSQQVAECNVGQLSSGQPAPPIVFYYRVPTTPGSYPYLVVVSVAEGGKDNSDGTSNNLDTFSSNTITTDVRAIDDDFVSGHSIEGVRSFSTGGIDCAAAGLPASCNDAPIALGAANPHGTAVKVGVNAEVTVSDVPPANDCPPAITTCFGSGSQLSVAYGAPVPGGIELTMRWDYTELPNGMTPRKLDVIHLFDAPVGGQTYALITDECDGPADTHCFVVRPFKLSDRDIQATVRLPFNGVSKGW